MGAKIGLSEERAKELLRDYVVPKVRLKSRNGQNHRNVAVLKALEGTIAIVQPPRHRGTERISLADISEWKSANGESDSLILFDNTPTSKAENKEESEQKAIKSSKNLVEYVVFSRLQQSMFSKSSRRWTTIEHLASKYLNESDAHRAANKLKKNDESSDAEVMLSSKARHLCVELHAEAVATETLSIPQKGNPLSLPATANPLMAAIVPVSSVSAISSDSLISENDLLASALGLNLDDGFDINTEPLIEAISDRVKAAKDFKEAREMLIESMKVLKEAESRIRDQARIFLSTKSESLSAVSLPGKENKTFAARGELKEAIYSVISENPNMLLKKQLISRVEKTGVSQSKTPRTSIGCGIETLLKSGSIKKNSNNTFCLV